MEALAADDWFESLRAAERPRGRGRIGTYEILEEIRLGAQGLVLRALDTTTGRQVALKRLAAGAFSTPLELRRFEREMELVAGLTHPGIVSLHGVETIDGVLLLAMEWVDGQQLSDWAQALPHARATVRKKLVLFRQLCDAVQHAHQTGVIHRDLKASNVMVDLADRPRLLDFGLAKRELANEANVDGLADMDRVDDATETIGFVGTPAYAAPESFSNDALPLDVRSDVYSLGVVLFELLTGDRPFRAQRLSDLIDEIQEREPPGLSSLDTTLDQELDTLVRKAMAKEPIRRYQTVHALGEDIDRYLDGRPVRAMPPSSAYFIGKWISRNRLAFGLMMMLVIVIAGAAIGVLQQASVIDAERNRVVTEKENVEKALSSARSEAAKARSVRDFYLNAFMTAATPHSPVGSTDVIDAIEYAVNTAQEHFSQHPEVAFEVQSQVARTLALTGHWERARTLAEEALARQTTAGILEGGTRALLMQTLGEVRHQTGDSRGGRVSLREAIALYTRPDGSTELPASLSSTLYSLSDVELTLGDPVQAEKYLREAIELSARARPTVDPTIQAKLADLLLETGRSDEAASLLDTALATAESEGWTEARLSTILTSVGELHWRQKQPEKALPYQRRAADAAMGSFAAGHPIVSWTAFAVARTLAELRRDDEALDAFQVVLDLDPNELLAAHALRGQADCLGRLGSMEEAIAMYEDVCAAYDRLLAATDLGRVEARIDLQALLVAAQRLEDARAQMPAIATALRASTGSSPGLRAHYATQLRENSKALGLDAETEALIENLGAPRGSD